MSTGAPDKTVIGRMSGTRRIALALNWLGMGLACFLGLAFWVAPGHEGETDAIVSLAWAGAGSAAMAIYLARRGASLPAAVCSIVAAVLGFIGVFQLDAGWTYGYELWLVAAVPLIAADLLYMVEWKGMRRALATQPRERQL
jgi:hypothetical protein